MPTTYSHMAFGERVLSLLGEDARGAALRNKILPFQNDFFVGVHGPDLLFYYHALIPNRISRIGHTLHSIPADALFTRLKETALGSEAGFAYAMGVVCHYILDFRCHPYVEEYKDKTGISHGEIELEMDWQMMVSDGLDPMHHRPADILRLTPELLEPLEKVYSGASAQQLGKALESMVFYCGIGVCPNDTKRRLMVGVMKAIGLGTLAKGHVICPERNPRCQESTRWLCSRLEETVPEAAELMGHYAGFLQGEEELPEIFGGTFMGPVKK